MTENFRDRTFVTCEFAKRHLDSRSKRLHFVSRFTKSICAGAEKGGRQCGGNVEGGKAEEEKENENAIRDLRTRNPELDSLAFAKENNIQGRAIENALTSMEKMRAALSSSSGIRIHRILELF